MMTRGRRTGIMIAAVAALFVLAAFAWANRHPELAPVEPHGEGAFDTALLRHGEALAGIGACEVCHTSESGAPFAGGRALPTPFGTVYSTNITPDVETGVGGWSEEAFRRAMRKGVDRRGRHLYPAFPYDHFTKVTDEDLHAIYAFLMTREPVAYEAPDNELSFPLDIRMLLAGWKLLYLETGAFEADESRDAEWNRGAYLAEGLGHCGACHTPRNAFGALIGEAAHDGADVEDWHAPALNARSPAPIPWSQEQLVDYLFDGWEEEHGIAAGPMAPVVNHLYDQSEDDVFAIAAYFASRQRPQLSDAEKETVLADAASLDWERDPAWRPEETPDDLSLRRGMEVYADQCANCHKRGSREAPVSLALTTTVNAPDPRNVIHIVFDGIRPPRGALQRSMPEFGASISDADIIDLLEYIRWHFTDRPPWEDVAGHVAAKRAAW